MGQNAAMTGPSSRDPVAEGGGFETKAYRAAIRRLGLSLADRIPVVALFAEGREAPRYVVRRFIDTLGDDVSLIHIAEPCEDVAALMRRVIRGIGFQPRDMSIADLDKICRLFLTFQKNHNRRTLLWVEAVEANNRWVLDKLAELARLESEGDFGLTLIMTGSPRLKKLFTEGVLGDAIPGRVTRLAIAPLSLEETREYVRRRVEGARGMSIDRQFDYQAISTLHELTGGVPDAVGRVLSRSLEIADAAGLCLVTAGQIARVHASLDAEVAGTAPDPAAETVTLDAAPPPVVRLIVKLDDEMVRELAVGQGHVLLGRGRLCDVRIPSPTVSRQHALIVFAWDGSVTLVDLSSTNGTFVDGYQVTEHPLVSGETITLGDCQIEYLAEPATDLARRRAGQVEPLVLSRS